MSRHITCMNMLRGKQAVTREGTSVVFNTLEEILDEAKVTSDQGGCINYNHMVAILKKHYETWEMDYNDQGMLPAAADNRIF